MKFLAWCALIGIILVQLLLHLQMHVDSTGSYECMNKACTGGGRELRDERAGE